MSSYVGNAYDFADLEAIPITGPSLAGGVKVTGRFEVVEYEAGEPDVGILGDCFTIVPEGIDVQDPDWDRYAFSVDAWEAIEQMDPDRVRKEREVEAEMEAEAEAEALWER